jgi:hypothetical protein
LEAVSGVSLSQALKYCFVKVPAGRILWSGSQLIVGG